MPGRQPLPGVHQLRGAGGRAEAIGDAQFVAPATRELLELAAEADHVETTVLDTQRALAQVALMVGRPAPELPPMLAPVAVQ